jgi:hypothetical protein
LPWYSSRFLLLCFTWSSMRCLSLALQIIMNLLCCLYCLGDSWSWCVSTSEYSSNLMFLCQRYIKMGVNFIEKLLCNHFVFFLMSFEIELQFQIMLIFCLLFSVQIDCDNIWLPALEHILDLLDWDGISLLGNVISFLHFSSDCSFCLFLKTDVVISYQILCAMLHDIILKFWSWYLFMVMACIISIMESDQSFNL